MKNKFQSTTKGFTEAIEYLKEKNMSVAKDTTDEDLMDLVVRG